MERKTKHRILGGFVLLSLAIFLLPFLKISSDPNSAQELIAAPPFPDQSVQVGTDQNNVPSPTANNEDQQIPNDTIRVLHPSIVSTRIPEIAHPKLKEPVKDRFVLNEDTNIKAEPLDNQAEATPAELPATPDMMQPHPDTQLTSQSENKTNKAKIQLTRHRIQPPVQSDPALNVKDAWVVQMGSFKNKTNALRLVNQLRANGYRAFIQEISTAFGDNTRVFVGPENKRTEAHALALRLENHLHMRGIVINYQPLTL